MILPFVRTPTNLLKFSFERSPFAPLMREWRADVRAGGARRDLALARSLMGTAFAAAMAEAAASGLLTGAMPRDRQRAAVLRANRWQPYSIYWDGQYYSYQRLDPFATHIGTAADFATRFDGFTERQQDNAATMLVASFMAQMGDKTWLSGVSDLVQAAHDPERYMGAFTKRLAGSLAVPTGVAQVARTMDPTTRARDNEFEAIQSRIPGMSDNLPPQRDILGRRVVSQGGIGPDILSPVWQSTNRNDPVLNELIRARIGFERPDRTVGGRRLSAGEYDRYQEATGRIAYPLLQELVTPDAWDGLSQDDKKEEVRDVMRGARALARGEVLGGGARTPSRRQVTPRLPAPSSLPPLPPGFEVVQ